MRFEKSKRYKTRRRRHKSRSAKGVNCCMCNKSSNSDTFIPLNCLNKPVRHKSGVHRICSKCWWDPKKGFALENGSHKCPGCEKGLPVIPAKKITEIIEID